MDSRLRGNDNSVKNDLNVIPAKAGIHAHSGKKSKKIICIYFESDYKWMLLMFSVRPELVEGPGLVLRQAQHER